MTVTKEENLRPLSQFLLQKTLYVGDDTMGSIPTVQGITIF
jgi:hypothetical protein